VPGSRRRQTSGSGQLRALTGLTGPTGLRSCRRGHTPAMERDIRRDRGDGLWLEAAAGVQSSVDADLRDEAYEVFVAEAARSRLVDRAGPARVSLRSGVVLDGELLPDSVDAVDGHLALVGADGRTRLVRVSAVVSLTGSRPSLRPEGDRAPRSFTSWLREIWSADEAIRVLDGSGSWAVGRLGFVGADHVELAHGESRTIIPLTSIEAWQRG